MVKQKPDLTHAIDYTVILSRDTKELKWGHLEDTDAVWLSNFPGYFYNILLSFYALTEAWEIKISYFCVTMCFAPINGSLKYTLMLFLR